MSITLTGTQKVTLTTSNGVELVGEVAYTDVKGDEETVNGSAFVAGDVQARSVQAFGPTISNFGQAFAEQFGSAHIEIAAGGNGYGFLDPFGAEVTRIVIGDPATSTAPASTLLIHHGPAQLWFRTDTGWVCLAGCAT